MLTSSPATYTLNACLGNYVQYFEKPSGFQVCIVGNSWQRILCWFSFIIHTLIASNALDAILLYVCFNKIKHQTEKSKELIGRRAYEVRKRYVKDNLCLFDIDLARGFKNLQVYLVKNSKRGGRDEDFLIWRQYGLNELI